MRAIMTSLLLAGLLSQTGVIAADVATETEQLQPLSSQADSHLLRVAQTDENSQLPAAKIVAKAADQEGQLEQIVVTAQKRSENLQDVPISVSVLSASDLANANVTTTQDLARTVPGLTFSTFGSFAQPAIRGISSTGAAPGDDSNVPVYLDGAYQVIEANNIFELPDVSRVEVVKGPQGTLFGRNSTGGAIQIFTLDPTFENVGSFGLTNGFYNGGGWSYIAHAFASTPLVDNTLAMSLSVMSENNQGFLHDEISHNRLGLDGYLLRSKLLFTPAPTVRVLASVYFSHRDDHIAQSEIALNGSTAARAVVPNMVINTGPYDVYQNLRPQTATRELGAQVKVDIDVGGGTLTSFTNYSWGHDNQQVDTTFSPVPYLNFINYIKDQNYTEELTYTSPQYGPVHFVVGGNYFYDDDAFNPAYITGVPAPLYSGVKSTSHAGYGELTFNLMENLFLIGGVRSSSDKEAYYGAALPSPQYLVGEHTWTSVTPRASLRYKIDAEKSVYLTYSEGYKSGVYDAFSFSPHYADPEKLHALEAGFKAETARFRFNGAVYYYKYDDIQVSVFEAPTAVTQNAAKSTIYGLDFDTSYVVTRDFSVTGSTAWMPHANYDSYSRALVEVPLPMLMGNVDVTRDESGARMIRAPVFTFSLTPTYNHAFSAGRLISSLSAAFSSPWNYEVTGRLREDAHWTLNGNLIWKPGDGPLRLSLWGKNITDARYLSSALPGVLADGIQYAPPRQIGISVDYNF